MSTELVVTRMSDRTYEVRRGPVLVGTVSPHDRRTAGGHFGCGKEEVWTAVQGDGTELGTRRTPNLAVRLLLTGE